MILPFIILLSGHSTFDVERSMFDVHPGLRLRDLDATSHIPHSTFATRPTHRFGGCLEIGFGRDDNATCRAIFTCAGHQVRFPMWIFLSSFRRSTKPLASNPP
jgi:hypothetical protein